MQGLQESDSSTSSYSEWHPGMYKKLEEKYVSITTDNQKVEVLIDSCLWVIGVIDRDWCDTRQWCVQGTSTSSIRFRALRLFCRSNKGTARSVLSRGSHIPPVF